MTPYGYPADQYHCLLDEQPYYLTPLRLLPQHMPGPEYIVNPQCWFAWHGPLPPAMAVRASGADALMPSELVIWVDDPGSGVLWPFWVGEGYVPFVSQMLPGYPPPDDLPEHVRWVLMCANILVEPNWAAHRRQDWRAAAAAAAHSFTRGYTAVPGLIHPFHLGALRRYYRHQVRTGAIPFGDGQVSRRYAQHNEPVTRYFHEQLAGPVSDIVRTVVKPSYSYFVAYDSGAILHWHTDRSQCEYSITLCVDAAPEPAGVSPWPIDLGTPDGTLRVFQHLGDALVYRGPQVPHSREMLPDGLSSSSMLLHYVDEDFAGPLS